MTTIGSILDWILKNWANLLILLSMVTALVKLIRKMDKVKDTIDDTKKKVEKIEKDYTAMSNSLKDTNDKISQIKNTVDFSEKKRIESSDRNNMILCGVEASLRGLVEVGADGPVKEALLSFEQYTRKKASE